MSKLISNFQRLNTRLARVGRALRAMTVKKTSEILFISDSNGSPLPFGAALKGKAPLIELKHAKPNYAYDIGLRSGDILMAINGVDTHFDLTKTLPSVAAMFRPIQLGTPISVVVLRDCRPPLTPVRGPKYRQTEAPFQYSEFIRFDAVLPEPGDCDGVDGPDMHDTSVTQSDCYLNLLPDRSYDLRPIPPTTTAAISSFRPLSPHLYLNTMPFMFTESRSTCEWQCQRYMFETAQDWHRVIILVATVDGVQKAMTVIIDEDKNHTIALTDVTEELNPAMLFLKRKPNSRYTFESLACPTFYVNRAGFNVELVEFKTSSEIWSTAQFTYQEK